MSTSDHTNRKRKRWNQEYQERRKRVQIPPQTQWGLYNLDFATSENKGIIELKKFILGLDKEAQWAKTNTDVIRECMMKLQVSKQSLEMIASVPTLLPTPPEDIIIVGDSATLGKHLGQNFEKPLLHRASQSGHSLAARHLDLETFWSYLREQPETTIDVYDYSVEDPPSRTRSMTVHNVLSHWKLPIHQRTALNLLDIENRIGEFCPTEIIQYDLLKRVLRTTARSIGKTDSDWKNNQQEFFLLSGANAISSIHVDNGAQLTWILILEGRKIWYFPRQITTRAVRWLALMGSQYFLDYEDGWARVELQPGDLLVLPPSCPHAVFTPEDCLAVGGHFFTAAHLGTTLRGLKLQEDYPDICNEDLDSNIYESLSKILAKFDSIGPRIAQADVLSYSSSFLDTPNLVTLSTALKNIKTKALPRRTGNQVSRTINYLDKLASHNERWISEREDFIDELTCLRQRIRGQWEQSDSNRLELS